MGGRPVGWYKRDEFQASLTLKPESSQNKQPLRRRHWRPGTGMLRLREIWHGARHPHAYRCPTRLDAYIWRSRPSVEAGRTDRCASDRALLLTLRPNELYSSTFPPLHPDGASQVAACESGDPSYRLFTQEERAAYDSSPAEQAATTRSGRADSRTRRADHSARCRDHRRQRGCPKAGCRDDRSGYGG